MILRRVIEHFRKQEWTAIFLDFIIVVAGILIAFQITAWNEARHDRALEHEYLERLYADVNNTLESRSRASDWDVLRGEQQALVLDALRSGVLREEDHKAFGSGLAYFGFISGVEVHWATVDELLSAGGMNLISDVSIRSRLLRFDADLKRRQGIAENFMESIYAFREQLGPRFQVVEFTGEREEIRVDFDFEALAADPAVLNSLSQIDMLSRFRQDLNKHTLEELTLIRDELAKELDLDEEEEREIVETPL